MRIQIRITSIIKAPNNLPIHLLLPDRIKIFVFEHIRSASFYSIDLQVRLIHEINNPIFTGYLESIYKSHEIIKWRDIRCHKEFRKVFGQSQWHRY